MKISCDIFPLLIYNSSMSVVCFFFPLIYFNWRIIAFNIVIFLPYIGMNQPQVYLCPPTLHPLPPPSPPHPSGWSQSTSSGCPASCMELALVICSSYGNVHVSVLISQIIPPSLSPAESQSLSFTSVSPLLPCT